MTKTEKSIAEMVKELDAKFEGFGYDYERLLTKIKECSYIIERIEGKGCCGRFHWDICGRGSVDIYLSIRISESIKLVFDGIFYLPIEENIENIIKSAHKYFIQDGNEI